MPITPPCGHWGEGFLREPRSDDRRRQAARKHDMGEVSMKFAARTAISFKAAMYLGVAALAVGMTSPAQAQAAEAKQLDIPAQALADTLTQTGRQTGSAGGFRPGDGRGRRERRR